MLDKWDERRQLVVPGDFAMTLAFSVNHWLTVAQASIKDHGYFAVALSGGSTPKAIYESLAMPHNAERIDWSKVFLFWSDERAVPPDHADSNYRMALEAGFSQLPVPSTQIFRMQAEKEIQANAQKYEEILKRVLKGRPLDLIMLGMGDDGHTASLFPHTAGLKVKDRLVIANEVPQKKTWRMSMTFTCINSAANTAIYVLGASKKQMLAEIFLSKEDVEKLPSQGVGTKEHPALWIADEAAAMLLLQERPGLAKE